MKKNFKAVLSVFAGIFVITAALGACAQTGTSRAPGRNEGRQLQNMQTPGYDGNNLVNTTPRLQQGNMAGTTPDNMQGYNMGNNTQGYNLGNTQRNTLGNNPGNTVDMNRTNGLETTPNRQKADTVKKQVMKMSGVEDANVIVIGDTALVGIKCNSGNTAAVKSNVAKKVKQLDNTIKNVTVSESADIMDRIKKLGSDITSNKPVKAVTDEFNKMIKGITPVMQ